MVAPSNSTDKPWDIQILKESNSGFLCLSPTGETAFLTKDQFIEMTQRRNQNGKNIHTVEKSKI